VEHHGEVELVRRNDLFQCRYDGWSVEVKNAVEIDAVRVEADVVAQSPRVQTGEEEQRPSGEPSGVFFGPRDQCFARGGSSP
jgi:hypothetical protein